MGNIKHLKFTREHFETSISKYHTSITELIRLHTEGVIKKEDPLFKLEDVIAICEQVAIGMWKNAGNIKAPNSKWGGETRAKIIRQVILNAFAI